MVLGQAEADYIHFFTNWLTRQFIGRWEIPAYEALRTRLWRHGEYTIAKKVSGYAAEKPLEFAQEVHAALMVGRKFDRDVMDLYYSLKGQK